MLRYSPNLIHTGHLSEEECDAAFWCGFHPGDREVLRPCLLGKNPFRSPDIPFHLEVVFGCARAAFANDDFLPSWSHEKFEPSSARREQLVAKHVSRDSYGVREVTCAVTSNAETTTTPTDFPHIHSRRQTLCFPSSSFTALESQYAPAHSATVDQPEPAPTLSTTLLPSASLTPTSQLASSFPHLAANHVPEIACTPHSSSSVLLTNSECLPSAMVDHPEFEPEPASLPSITPTSPSLSFAPSLVCVPADDDPEIASTLLPFIATLPFTPSHVHSVIDNDLIFRAYAPSSSTFLPSPVTSETDDQPEPESMSVSVVLSRSLNRLRVHYHSLLTIHLPLSFHLLPTS